MKQKSGQIYHTATYNERTYTATLTEWGRILEASQTAVERGLRNHYSMQALIDEEFADKQRQLALFRVFCFGSAYHGC